jgi:hypothetical protein
MTQDSDVERAEVIYEGYKEIIGEAAEGIAKNKDYVEFEDGKIKEFNGDEDDMNDFVESFKDTIGEVAIRIGKKKLEEENVEDIPETLED